MNSSAAPQNGFNQAFQPWLKESVKTFFESISWDGRPLQVVAGSAISSPVNEVSMTMRVGVFFSAIPWEGQPVIASPIAPLEMLPTVAEPANDSLTLDAFSDLF